MKCITIVTVNISPFKRLLLFMFFLVSAYNSSAQQKCEGVWGTPLVNITFSAGSNPGSSLHAATSVYTYVTGDCPNDGAYTIRNNSTDCFYNDWHTIKQDHTGDPNGYFLLINASFQSNDFYLDTLKNLCSNTTYEFAAWILNMTRPSSCGNGGVKPNITFRVEKLDGTLLDSFNTKDIATSPEPVWNKYSFVFFSVEPAIVLRMTNTNAGGCGGDFAIDDITFRPCTPSIPTTETEAIKKLTVFHCRQQDTSFTFRSRFNNIYNQIGYLWEESVDTGKTWIQIPGADLPQLTKRFYPTLKESLALYRLSVGEKTNMAFADCITKAPADTVATISGPTPVFTSNSPICEGSNLLLQAAGDYQFNWTGPAGFSGYGSKVSVQDVQQANSGSYFLNTVASTGCASSDSLLVTVNPSPHAYAGPDITICEGTPVQLSSNGGDSYAWSPSVGLSNANQPDPVAVPSDTTVYTVTVTNQFACTSKASTKLNILKKPSVDAGPDKKIAAGNSVTLEGKITGTDITYFWSPNNDIDNANLINPLVNPRKDVVYTLTGISDHGCGTAQDEVTVEVLKIIDVPNAFSPNNDGINDAWTIKNLDMYTSADVTVFSRSGQKVFFSHGYGKPWDGLYNGSIVPIGTYYYIIDLKAGNAILQGSVTILR